MEVGILNPLVRLLEISPFEFLALVRLVSWNERLGGRVVKRGLQQHVGLVEVLACWLELGGGNIEAVLLLHHKMVLVKEWLLVKIRLSHHKMGGLRVELRLLLLWGVHVVVVRVNLPETLLLGLELLRVKIQRRFFLFSRVRRLFQNRCFFFYRLFNNRLFNFKGLCLFRFV